MKTVSALAIALWFSVGLASAQNQNNRDRVCVYQDIGFHGWEQCYRVGDEITSFDRRNNAISSIRIYGRARVTVYEDTEFRGKSAEFASDVPDLGLRNLSGSKSWSDHIQSMRVGSDYGPSSNNNSRNLPVFGRDQQSNPRQQLNEGVCVYDRPDYEGREQCWNTGMDIGDLARAGNWSDRISSVRVFGGAVAILYRDINFNGESITIDRDVPNLNQVTARNFRNWDRQASSLAIEDSRRGFPGRGRVRGRGRF